MQGVSAVFFAYIGFDAISTTAEECRDPKRDLPRGIFGALIICTILYVLISLTLTGMIPYHELNVGDPLAFVFGKLGLHWISWIVAFSALIAMASVLLVFQMGQPRIWMSMSRDGLLPKKFSQVHPRFRTPSFSTIFTGFAVALPTFFMNQAELVDLTSIGTLFAFVLVCGGVLMLPKEEGEKKSFQVPYFNGRYFLPVIILAGLAIGYYLGGSEGYKAFFGKFTTSEGLWNNFPMLIFMIVTAVLAVSTHIRQLSLIPILGLISCFYLMTELGPANWMRFLIWLIVGLGIYFLYGYRKSTLNFANKKTD
jgi:amino acid transporter